MTTPVNDTLAEDRHTIARRLKGCAQRRELPTWGEIEFAADAILDLLARNSPVSAAAPDLTGERVHDLKTWPEFFQAIVNGDKTFEVRKDDRGYRAGDYLRLKEWHPRSQTYSGREMVVEVTYLLCDPLFGITREHVCMAIKPVITSG